MDKHPNPDVVSPLYYVGHDQRDRHKGHQDMLREGGLVGGFLPEKTGFSLPKALLEKHGFLPGCKSEPTPAAPGASALTRTPDRRPISFLLFVGKTRLKAQQPILTISAGVGGVRPVLFEETGNGGFFQWQGGSLCQPISNHIPHFKRSAANSGSFRSFR